MQPSASAQGGTALHATLHWTLHTALHCTAHCTFQYRVWHALCSRWSAFFVAEYMIVWWNLQCVVYAGSWICTYSAECDIHYTVCSVIYSIRSAQCVYCGSRSMERCGSCFAACCITPIPHWSFLHCNTSWTQTPLHLPTIILCPFKLHLPFFS